MSDWIKNGDELGGLLLGCLQFWGSVFLSQARSFVINVLGQHLWERNPRCPRDDLSQKPSLYGHFTDGKIEPQSGKELPKIIANQWQSQDLNLGLCDSEGAQHLATWVGSLEGDREGERCWLLASSLRLLSPG